MARPLTTGNSVDDASQFATSEIAPSASALVLLFVVNVKPLVSFGTPATPSITGNGLTWELVTTLTNDAGDRRLSCFRALGAAPTRGRVVIGFNDQTQGICAWSIAEYAGVDTGGTNGSGAVPQSQTGKVRGTTTLTVNITPADARDHTVGAIMLESFNEEPVAPGSGFSEIHQQTVDEVFGKSVTLQTQDSATGLGKVTWSWTDDLGAFAIVVDVKAAPVVTPPTTADPTTALIRRFEPILHFHPMESFAPVNAKRFVESAALWGARKPFDDKNSWGTAALVQAGQLSTNPASDHYLGKPDNVVADKTHERFLEMGGWKDATSVYANRDAILSRYRSDLASDKFWYHAERFDTARLTRLASSVTTPALSMTLRGFKNPTLLCYYLFYPAHEQGVDSAACGNVEAKELACHAGDWQCFAVLLDGDGTTAASRYTPKFFGITGLRPAPDTDGRFRPYAFDAEGRTAMKVEAWRTGSPDAPVQPDVVGDNPRFYVARGTHGMYTGPGDHAVSPFDDASSPAGCGRFDTPSAVPPPAPDDRAQAAHDSEDAVPIIILVSTILAGLLFNELLVGLFGGIAAAVDYVSQFPFGGDPSPSAADPPATDAAPASAGAGITVRPKNVRVPGVTSTEPLWPGDDHVGDVVVDRVRQVWWPSDDGTSGFRGRWGQRVASDPVLHRAGVKFPDYWKMFLTALEQGFVDGTLTRP